MRVAAAAWAIAWSAGAPANDALTVADPWVRATVAGQSVAGAYMRLTARAPFALIGAASPLAAKAELHTMSVAGGVMRMRPLERVELPAGKTVHLEPGGQHVMLIGVQRQLKPGERVPVMLTMQDAKGGRIVVQVDAEVRSAGNSTHQGRH